MCTIIGDTLKDYGTDKEGGRVHDLLGTRCDPYGIRCTGIAMLIGSQSVIDRRGFRFTLSQ